ncbi:MAG: glycerol kinase [Deltaproteobacteria bacterium]|nr:MAG: glycerol kinase [Deltaproteobacteria bacterium]
MSGEHLLALDLGTTRVRALVVAPDGVPRGRAYRPLRARYPAAGRVEQDPAEMWARSVEVLAEALDAAGLTARDVAAIGVASQRATALAWDRVTREPLAPAIGWQDRRTERRAQELAARGVPINALASATKFEWWLRSDANVQAARARGALCLGTPDAWLGFKLTGGSAFVTDPGQASCTGLFFGAQRTWDSRALELFGLDASLLPRVTATSAVEGETGSDLLGAPIAVAARAGDQQAAAFAQGVHRAGEAKLTLGTAAMLDLHTGAQPAPPVGGAWPLPLWRLADGAEAFALEATVITAGAVVEWLVELGLLSEPAALDRVAGQVASSEGVAFVPALQGLGAPYLDGAARGLLGGLTRGSLAAHVVRAALEGIAQRCVDVCEALDLADAPLKVDGGLARSDLLLQRLADLAGLEVLRAAETETTALGAAFLAGLASGVFPSPETCRRRAPAPERFEPSWDPQRRAPERARWKRIVARARADAEGRAASAPAD